MLQNDARRGNDNDGFVIPKVQVLEDEAVTPASPVLSLRPRLRTGPGSTSSSDYMQQFRRNFVSYGEFLASYWDHLPQTFTRVLGESGGLYVTSFDNSCPRSCAGVWRVHGSNQGIRRCNWHET